MLGSVVESRHGPNIYFVVDFVILGTTTGLISIDLDSEGYNCIESRHRRAFNYVPASVTETTIF